MGNPVRHLVSDNTRSTLDVNTNYATRNVGARNLLKAHGLALWDTRCHSRAVSDAIDDNMRATERLRHWFGEAAREYRKGAKVTVRTTRIADELGMNVATIERFEKGLHWPKSPEAFARAYAEACDVRNAAGEIDARLILDRAVELWKTKGHRPLLPAERAVETGPVGSSDIADALKDAAKSAADRERQERAEDANGSRKKQQGGESPPR
jgi:transcriptional regulator with XRE-family HTH domain